MPRNDDLFEKITASSGFDITQAVKLKEIEENPKKATELIQPIDAFFKEYTQVDLTEEKWLKVKNGAGISLETNAKKSCTTIQ